ncbi:hypothetical protein A943_05600 [Bacillus sp. CPSM8]|uniref:hypothetical protein n=1 Tax=Bacillus TaxID=1386 RepID=UPI00039FA91C|nr:MULTISPECIES: hypothetical protein [Bacillus]ETB72261.1 hypothetical protein A943_05600 [Bacillus sp. CPSM8]MBX9436627.1 hypothetical protein [Bacillus paralicheniformis]MCY1631333.1 hypothetical protein [Bacillus paralicheniformis]MDE1384587.1 hypothetical protein [Bacillus paralicheniformis]TAI52048.1 hypothetical protein CXP52_06635 [Bacillus paralicheniformis]
MRQKDIKHLLQKYNEQIEIHVNTGSKRTIHGLQKSLNAINELSALGFLDEDIKRFKQLGNIYYTRSPQDRIEVDAHIASQIEQNIKIVKEKLNGFITLINKSMSKQDANTISVKLPYYDSLDDLEKFTKKLNNAFQSGITNKETKGHFKLQGFDTGSMWMDILVSSPAALLIIGKIIDAAQKISINSQGFLISKAHYERIVLQNEQQKKQNEASDIFLAGLQKSIDAITEAEIKNVTEGANYSQESINEIKTSAKLFAELLHEGAQFHPSLDAPKEAIESFPEPPQSLEEPQKLLESLIENPTEE